MSKIPSPTTDTWVGVRCKKPNVAGDWSYLGSNYIQNTNTNWATGEPSSSCNSEQCMHIKTNNQWNDITCGKTFNFICGLPVCGR